MLKFLRNEWRTIIIALLALLLISGGLPVLGDVIKIQPPPALNDLTDVNATSPNNYDVLTWDTGLGEWINAASAGAGANQTGRSVTYTVAASDALDIVKAQADYVCTGSDDQNTIQSALDALPDGGGWVSLSQGIFNLSASIDLSSNQILSGCGNSTILTTSTVGLIFLSAVGGNGTEKTGIIISDLQIDGGAERVSDCGIYFEYVDYSLIQNVYSKRHLSDVGDYNTGIQLLNSDFNTLTGNSCQGNSYGIRIDEGSNNIIPGNTCQGNTAGISLYDSSSSTIVSNTCQGNSGMGILLDSSNSNSIFGNTCQGNGVGICLYVSSDNTVMGNTCQGNDTGIFIDTASYIVGIGGNNSITGNTCQGNSIGIFVDDTNGDTVIGNICQGNSKQGIKLEQCVGVAVIGNTCIANSQGATNAYDDIFMLHESNYNNIQGNTCRAGNLINKPCYGINIAQVDCIGNLVINNDLYDDGFGTAPYNDDGTGTIYVEPSDTADAIAKTHDRLHSLTSVSDHSGVNITSPADNDVICWNNATSMWESKAIVSGGDMLKSTYDTNNDGVVDAAEALTALATKNPPVDNDTVVQRDSTNSDSLFTSTWTQIKAFLKSFFDGIYAPLSDFLGLNATVNALNTTVSGHTTDIGNLQGDVSGLQDDVSGISDNVTTVQGDISDLQGNVTGLKTIAIIYVIDGGGSAITIGQKGHLSIPFGCTITSWTLLADQSGNITIDVWKDTYVNFPPTVADNITGSEIPTLSSVQNNRDLDLTTWTTTVTAGDILAFNVDSCTTVTRVTLTITATRIA